MQTKDSRQMLFTDLNVQEDWPVLALEVAQGLLGGHSLDAPNRKRQGRWSTMVPHRNPMEISRIG